MASPESMVPDFQRLTMSSDKEPLVSVSFSYHGRSHIFSFPANSTISDLSQQITEILCVPLSNQKLMISKFGLLKPPFKEPDLSLSSIADKKITLMGSTSSEVAAVSIAAEEAVRRFHRRNIPTQKVKAHKTHDWKKEQEESQYTFTTLRPLPYLPNPSRSLQFLQRLKDDAGIKAVMRKHKFTVPLLTEMNPVEHTQSNHEGTSRTLGLNRNRGEVIELRLRTDAYDGYRDYRTIRRTLCHELVHNVHGPHDRYFWDLCKQIEREVEVADWRSGGNFVGNTEFYQAEEADIDNDCTWTGGEFVLGADKSDNEADVNEGLSRSEILAKAAEERMKRLREQNDEPRENADSH